MTLNDVAVRELGGPPAVTLGYDARGKRIALRASLSTDAGAMQLKPSRTADGHETGSSSIFARSFLSYYGIERMDNNVYRLEDLGDGVYVLSLGEPLPKGRPARREAGP